ncbi:MAG: prepilin-type N-terminal cleavage/methylation domain-containing protein [Candidatus Wallbacteria bacterium]|nr:prepilin-type N-terminal cleavage/methylation domain-containing protein [Candidatus Wallbacteria bacterium]
MTARAARSGFGLVEILVAIAILFAILFVMVSLIDFNTSTTQGNREYLLATKLAQNMLDRYGAYPSWELMELFGPGTDSRGTVKTDRVLNSDRILTSDEIQKLGISRELFYHPDPSASGSGYLEARVDWVGRKDQARAVKLGRLVMDQRRIRLPGPRRARKSKESGDTAPTPEETARATTLPGSGVDEGAGSPDGTDGAEEAEGLPPDETPADGSAPAASRDPQAKAEEIADAEEANRQFKEMMEGMLHEHFHAGDSDHHVQGWVRKLASAAPDLDWKAANESPDSAGRIEAARRTLETQEIPDGTYRYTFRRVSYLDVHHAKVDSVIYTLEATGARTYVLVRETRNDIARLEGRQVLELGDRALVATAGAGRVPAAHVGVTERRCYVLAPGRDSEGRTIPFALEMTLATLEPALPRTASEQEALERVAPLLAAAKVSLRSASPLPGTTASRRLLGW